LAIQYALLEGSDNISLYLDFDEEFAMNLVAETNIIVPLNIVAMKLDPLTSVEDESFQDRILENKNLPEWVCVAI